MNYILWHFNSKMAYSNYSDIRSLYHSNYSTLNLIQWNLCIMDRHLGTNQRYPDYQGVLIFQVSLYDKAPFGTIARCPDYAGVHIFKCPD